MKCWLFCVIAAMSLVSTPMTGQTSADIPPTALNFENGAIANGVYSNECFGFLMPIPAGWKMDESIIAAGKAKHLSNKSLALLFLRRTGDSLGRIIVSGSITGDETSTAQDFASRVVHDQIKASPDRELVRDASAVDYGGLHFFRSDYKSLWEGKQPYYSAYVYTKFRGYFIGETIVSGSSQGLDDAANSLQAISFQQDQVNPNCVMAPDVRATTTAKPERVRVSQGVSRSLLIEKVNPKYPDVARQARIQGQVVLQALIDKEGNIAELNLVSGHPLLAPEAIKAVQQWKYKPYLLNEIPVAMETQIIVNFTLSDF
jgi:TonB family protein